MELTDEQVERLKSYRQQAFERLRQLETRRYVNNEEYYAIRDIVYDHYTRSPDMNTGVAYQMHYDLKIYKLYDALAMWLDHEAGLAHWEPELILRVGDHFFGQSGDG